MVRKTARKGWHAVSGMKWTMAAIAVAVSLIAGGCGNSGDQIRSNMNGDYNGYSQDGTLGYSSSNPNLPNRMQSTNYASDRDFISELLEPFADIEDIQINFNENELNVDLKVNRAVTDQQLRKLRMDAQTKLQTNMPRYEVHVKAQRS